MNEKLLFKIAILVAVPLLFQLIFVAVLLGLKNQAELEAERLDLAKRTIAQTQDLMTALYDASTSLFFYRMTGSDAARDTYARSLSDIPDALKELDVLVRQKPTEQLAAVRMRRLAERQVHTIKELYAQRNNGPEGMISGRLGLEILRNSNLLLEDSNVILQCERANLQPAMQNQYRQYITLWLMAGVAGSTLVTFLLTFMFNRDIVARLAVIVENTIRVPRRLPLRAPVRGRDEIAQLDRTFHHMADELKTAAQKERALIESSVDVICFLTEDLRFSTISPSCLESWGYSVEELMGKPFTHVMTKESGAEAEVRFSEAKATDSPLSFESKVVCQDGRLANILWSGRWSGEQGAYFCVAHDITDRKRIEKLKQEFVDMLGHDLKAPLASTQLFLSYLTSDPEKELSDRIKKQARAAELNIRRLIGLIRNLLDLERLQSGKIELHYDLVPIQAIISSAFTSVQSLAESRAIAIKIPSVDGIVYCDEDALIRVIVNLLSNAVKFSQDKQSIDVVVSQDDAGTYFDVIDHGRGIPKEFAEKIFEPYEQVQIGDARLQDGTGLGLAICKLIIDLHGGKISLDSEVGGGSKFSVFLPSHLAASHLKLFQ